MTANSDVEIKNIWLDLEDAPFVEDYIILKKKMI